jgi:chromosome partitioning protein
MSTNLGWPSEPDPEPEHRRLGWLARMLSVSRETDEVTVEDVVAAGAAAGAAVSDDRDGEVAHAGDAAATGDAQGDVIALETPAGSAMPDDHASPSTAVDNAVDEVPTTPAFEREIPASEAGDKPVDDRADREALAAAIPTPGTDTPLGRELADNTRRRIQLTGRQFPKPVSPRVLTVANQKGGVGKTTTTVNVAAALAQSGLRALVIDLDPQGNASTALGIDHHAEVPSIYDVLVDSAPLLDVVQPCSTVENLFCAPATIDLAGAEIELVSLVARESRLQKAIAAAGEGGGHEFDYILIDCPPSLGLLTVNAMVAASEVFIPIQCEYYALEGLSQLLKNIDLIKRHLNPTLHVSTILLTMYDGRTRLSAQVADEVREHFPQEVLRTTVPRSVRVSEAPSFGETVMTYDPASSGALAYLEAAGELADRGAAGPT